MLPSKKDSSECVRVVIRCRPLSAKEKNDGHKSCVVLNNPKGTIEITDPRSDKSLAIRRFTFDAVYDDKSKQRDLYEETFSDLVQSSLEGFNSTIFAYGQTGTGKTFTIQGTEDDKELMGLIPRAFHHVFDYISKSNKDSEFLVRASYLEIYKEEIRDLLQPDQKKRFELREKPEVGVYVKDLSSVVTKSYSEIEKILKLGLKNRSVGATSMNELSSRSHAIFIITIEESQIGNDNKSHIRVGKLNFVDLAGSERQSKTNSEGERLKEATKINLSLSSLGNVISALVDGSSTHVPYRDSKLTRLLQNSLGGNSKTIMVANIGPASYNFDESLNTLRYANRAKSIKNTPRINEDPKDALLQEYQDEIERLRKQLLERSKINSGVNDDDSKAYQDYLEEQQKRLAKEKEKILNNQNLMSEEKNKLLENLKTKKNKLQEEESMTKKLAERLKYMESKLLHADQSIIEKTKDQEATLVARSRELAIKRAEERKMLEKMEEEAGNVATLQEGFSSLKQEVEVNTKRLRKLYDKYQEMKREIEDTKEEYRVKREDHEAIQEGLIRDIKLEVLLLDNFLPRSERDRLLKRIFYDESEDKWKFKSFEESIKEPLMFQELTGTGPIDIICQYARLLSKIDSNPRFRHNRLLDLDLDLPLRTTKEYQPPELNPQVVAALEAALQNEEDLEFDAMPSVFTSSRSRLRKNASKN